MDPFTIATTVASIASSLFGGSSQATQLHGQGQMALADAQLEQQGDNAQADVADLSAQQALNNAAQARAEAGVMAMEALMQGRATVASGAVQAAANGGGLGGSALGVLANLGQMATFNARVQAYKGLTASQSDIADAALQTYQGELDRWGGRVAVYKGEQQKAVDDAGGNAAMTQGVVGAGASLFAGMGKLAAAARGSGAASGLGSLFSSAPNLTGAGDLMNFA